MLAQASVADIPATNAEFPRYDLGAWHVERTGLIAKAAERRLREAPDVVGTLELLAEAHRIGDALKVLWRIVDKHPEDMARAFEVVSLHNSEFLDRSRDYPETVHQLVDAARNRYASLTREQAARTERQVLMVEDRPLPNNSFEDRLRVFIAEYPGTEAALLTEIDVIQFSGAPLQQKVESLDRIVRDHPGTVAAAKALHVKGYRLSGPSARRRPDAAVSAGARYCRTRAGARRCRGTEG